MIAIEQQERWARARIQQSLDPASDGFGAGGATGRVDVLADVTVVRHEVIQVEPAGDRDISRLELRNAHGAHPTFGIRQLPRV